MRGIPAPPATEPPSGHDFSHVAHNARKGLWPRPTAFFDIVVMAFPASKQGGGLHPRRMATETNAKPVSKDKRRKNAWKSLPDVWALMKPRSEERRVGKECRCGWWSCN